MKYILLTLLAMALCFFGGRVILSFYEVHRRQHGKPPMERRRFTLLSLLCGLLLAAAVSLAYLLPYAPAEDSALPYMEDSDAVTVTEAEHGYYFDGPGEEAAILFVPGAKVDETAYIPLLYRFAEEGMDVCLVKMPFHLAVFGIDKADEVMAGYEYESWYIGGHSLGGAMGAVYAAGHEDELRGVVLLAAYATKKLDDPLKEIVVYGSEDRVIRSGRLTEGRKFAPKKYVEHVIEGGNHAMFGNYGEQKGDGAGLITNNEQQAETVRVVMEAMGK